jgi:hypothetical protein
MARELSEIPPDMRGLYWRFERWRSTRTGRFPIPGRLWAGAAELAQQHCEKQWPFPLGWIHARTGTQAGLAAETADPSALRGLACRPGNLPGEGGDKKHLAQRRRTGGSRVARSVWEATWR